MDLIFETPFRGEVTEIRMADAVYRAGVDDAGHVCVEAPMDVGRAQGWIRRVDLELKRKVQAEPVQPEPDAASAITEQPVDAPAETKKAGKGRK